MSINQSQSKSGVVSNINLSNAYTVSKMSSVSSTSTANPDIIENETQLVLAEIEQQSLMKSDIDKRLQALESQHGQILNENTFLRKMVIESANKQAVMQERMEKIIRGLFMYMNNGGNTSVSTPQLLSKIQSLLLTEAGNNISTKLLEDISSNKPLQIRDIDYNISNTVTSSIALESISAPTEYMQSFSANTANISSSNTTTNLSLVNPTPDGNTGFSHIFSGLNTPSNLLPNSPGMHGDEFGLGLELSHQPSFDTKYGNAVGQINNNAIAVSSISNANVHDDVIKPSDTSSSEKHEDILASFTGFDNIMPLPSFDFNFLSRQHSFMSQIPPDNDLTLASNDVNDQSALEGTELRRIPTNSMSRKRDYYSDRVTELPDDKSTSSKKVKAAMDASSSISNTNSNTTTITDNSSDNVCSAINDDIHEIAQPEINYLQLLQRNQDVSVT